MSGTPLHKYYLLPYALNDLLTLFRSCIEELYPYFNFLKVPKCTDLAAFEKRFWDAVSTSIQLTQGKVILTHFFLA